jgi:hypothetical protein
MRDTDLRDDLRDVVGLSPPRLFLTKIFDVTTNSVQCISRTLIRGISKASNNRIRAPSRVQFYSAEHCFWPVKFSCGRLGESHYNSDSVSLVLLSASISTVDLVTPKFQANKHPPLATSPQPVGPSVSLANFSACQKPCTALLTSLNTSHRHRSMDQRRFVSG